MRRIRYVVIASLGMMSFGMSGAQEPKNSEQRRDTDEPDLVITPHTVRVQPADPDEIGHWIVMPGYSELGSPCFSRDGLWIALDAYKQGYNNSGPETWIARRDGTGLKKLANGATPRWSPDGKRLLFMRGSQNEPNQESHVYTIHPDGTNEQKLVPGRWPDWSPDGARIVFSRGGLPGGGSRVGAAIFTCAADGTDEIHIGDGDCPSWSPDGKMIACCFRARGARPVIRVIDLETKETKALGIGWFRANWMSDGKAVVANSFTGRMGMVKLSLENPREPASPLFSQFEDPASPCPSADGQYFVFIAKRPKKGGDRK
jgi:hypothetical protein